MIEKEIRAEIWRLVQQAPSMEIVHWYVSLDDCFENDEFQTDEMVNMKWRATVLHWRHEPVGYLLKLVDEIVCAYEPMPK